MSSTSQEIFNGMRTKKLTTWMLFQGLFKIHWETVKHANSEMCKDLFGILSECKYFDK